MSVIPSIWQSAAFLEKTGMQASKDFILGFKKKMYGTDIIACSSSLIT